MFNFYNDPAGCGGNYCPPGWLPQKSSEVAGSNKFFYHKFEDLALISLVSMVPMIIASQGSVALVRTCPHWLGPFEIREVLDNGQELVIGDVESSELGEGEGVFFLLVLPVWELLALSLAAFLFG